MIGPSHGYAQTNIQLYRQLQREGYPGSDLAQVRRAYELAMELFTTLYRPSGKSNLEHLVGTASILGRLRVPIDLLGAALLHPAYSYGDFGGLAAGISRRKRGIVRRAVGAEAEAHVARYITIRSSLASVSALHAAFPALDRIGRNVALIRLADVLEDHLDQGILYCPNAAARRKSCRRMRPELVTMAEELGFPVLASEIDRVLGGIGTDDVPLELASPTGGTRVFLVALPSYRPRLSISVGRQLVKQCGHLGAWVSRGLGHASRWRRPSAERVGSTGEAPVSAVVAEGPRTRGHAAASRRQGADGAEQLDRGSAAR
jgi:hypothetical protein